MNAPVDVLAVMDEAALSQSISGDRADMRAARAAVAELIEAAARANGDHHAPHDCYATGPLTGDPYRDLVECPGCVLAAALARVHPMTREQQAAETERRA